MPIADGADQLPSGRRAIIKPDPKRAEPRKPARRAVKMAIPLCGVSYGFVCRVSFGGLVPLRL